MAGQKKTPSGISTISYATNPDVCLGRGGVSPWPNFNFDAAEPSSGAVPALTSVTGCCGSVRYATDHAKQTQGRSGL